MIEVALNFFYLEDSIKVYDKSLSVGNKLHSGAVKKGAEDKLGKKVLGMPDTSQIPLSVNGPLSCMDSTTD